MSRTEIVLMNELVGYGIYDTENESFIGFRKVTHYNHSKKIKSVWTKPGHAKTAFKEHVGIYFKDQDRYEIREVGK